MGKRIYIILIMIAFIAGLMGGIGSIAIWQKYYSPTKSVTSKKSNIISQSRKSSEQEHIIFIGNDEVSNGAVSSYGNVYRKSDEGWIKRYRIADRTDFIYFNEEGGPHYSAIALCSDGTIFDTGTNSWWVTRNENLFEDNTLSILLKSSVNNITK